MKIMKKQLCFLITMSFIFVSTMMPLAALEDVNNDVTKVETSEQEGNLDTGEQTQSDNIQPKQEETEQETSDDQTTTDSEPDEDVIAPTITYRTHVQTYGWQNYVNANEVSGTTGQSKRLEAIQIKLDTGTYTGNISYQTHVQTYGWIKNVGNNEVSGTSGQSKRLEAIRIGLTGDIANYYDIYYRVHAQNLGWLSWASNNASAGTAGYSYRLEGIQIVLVKKGEAAPGDTSKPFVTVGNVSYSTHVQTYGWQGTVVNGQSSGTSGQSKRLEGIKISVSDDMYSGGVEYTTHVQTYGWQNYVSDGAVSGTQGQSKRLEGIKIRLTGEMANQYDIYYRVHAQNVGWMGWTCNDGMAGTAGGSFRLEAIQIKLCRKNTGMPGQSANSAINFISTNGYLTYHDAFGTLHENGSDLACGQSSYQLRVNKATNVVTVLSRNGNGAYNVAYKRFVCSTGAATPVGTFRTPAKYRWRELMGPSYGQFSTRIVGGVLFHSVPYNKPNNRTLSARMYNQLGTTCSHGCVRLTTADAKWIYDNCALGTTVHVVGGGTDPLSKPSAQIIPLTQTWDPTDPTL